MDLMTFEVVTHGNVGRWLVEALDERNMEWLTAYSKASIPAWPDGTERPESPEWRIRPSAIIAYRKETDD